MVLTDNLPLENLYIMIKQHKSHIIFLKDRGMLTDAKKDEIVDKISYVFDIINGRSERKRREKLMVNLMM